MSGIYQHIVEQQQAHKKMFAVLVDPEKCFGETLIKFVETLHAAQPDFIFVGGSQLSESVEQTVLTIKQLTNIPVVLFPGNALQISDKCDAVLLLSLVSGRNPEYLIGQHIKAAERIKQSGLETIPTGYILIDGGRVSAVAQVSQTTALPPEDEALIRNTAIASELMGHKLIYLEAGSGALHCVPPTLVEKVKKAISVPLIVGGGIASEEQIIAAMQAGADIVVIGNFLERHPERIPDFCHCVKQYNMKNSLS